MRRTSIRRWWGALFRLAFAAPTPTGLSSLDTPTRWPIIQKVRRHPMKRLRLLVGIRFQVTFTLLVGVLFTFPSRHWFAIGTHGILRLGGWSLPVDRTSVCWGKSGSFRL